MRSWSRSLSESHDAAFAIAKTLPLDLLSKIKDCVDRAIAEGWTFKRFQDELDLQER